MAGCRWPATNPSGGLSVGGGRGSKRYPATQKIRRFELMTGAVSFPPQKAPGGSMTARRNGLPRSWAASCHGVLFNVEEREKNKVS